MTSEEQLQKFYTDDSSLPRSASCFWLLEANFQPVRSTTQMWVAKISWHHHWFHQEMTPEERLQKFFTDDGCVTTQICIVLLIAWSQFSVSKKHHPDVGSQHFLISPLVSSGFLSQASSQGLTHRNVGVNKTIEQSHFLMKQIQL